MRCPFIEICLIVNIRDNLKYTFDEYMYCGVSTSTRLATPPSSLFFKKSRFKMVARRVFYVFILLIDPERGLHRPTISYRPAPDKNRVRRVLRFFMIYIVIFLEELTCSTFNSQVHSLPSKIKSYKIFVMLRFLMQSFETNRILNLIRLRCWNITSKKFHSSDNAVKLFWGNTSIS
jgi:hypothetical protein